MKKLIVILGPTASGKSALSVKLAKKFGGEIISADSRQVYNGLNIGSGKITKKEMEGIPHHLLSIASPKRRFTVAQYCSRAIEAMATIRQHGKVPFFVGGSPLYIYAAVDGWVIPEVKPNAKIRKQLEKLTAEQLLQKLFKLDPRRAQTIEQKNPRRLIRALEIVMTTKKPVPPLQKLGLPRLTGGQAYPVLFLGIRRPEEELKKRNALRLEKRFKQGMIAEVKKLHAQDISWKRLEELGLEYRYIARYLQEKLSLREMKTQLYKAILDFSRRQMTWFKKDQRIHWVKNQKEAENLIRLSYPYLNRTKD